MAELFVEHAVSETVGDGLVVEADPTLIDRVLENLLLNAVKHTPAGTPIHMSARSIGHQVAVAVADHGPGIPENEVRHLGERFFRGGDTNTRRTGGLGLGLALVAETLRLHGSQLEVQSVVGEGSSFSFHLPLVGSNGHAPALADPASQGSATRSS